MNISSSRFVILHVHLIRQALKEYSGCYFTYCHIHNLCAHSRVSLAAWFPSPSCFVIRRSAGVCFSLCAQSHSVETQACRVWGGGVVQWGPILFILFEPLSEKRTAGRRGVGEG